MNNMVNNKGSGADLRQITAIVPAAGVGARMPSYCPKQYRLLDEKTVLEHTVNMLCAHPQVTEVVVAISSDDSYFARTSLAHKAHVRTVVGGSTRAESVLAALVTVTTPWVMVHDAARPCVTHADIDKLIACAQAHPHDGAILAVPAKDTMKQAQSGADAIATTIDRSLLWHALTPQMFMREMLLEALLHAQVLQLQVTDEASALELRGIFPKLVAGSGENIKITVEEDLDLAKFFLKKRGQLDAPAHDHQQADLEKNMFRIGHGFDVHKFAGSGPITLGGVKISYEQGLLAHSDGDVALHAICDALLGALGLGDIGHHFPDNDPTFKGIDSRHLLRDVYNRVCQQGYQLGNLDVTIIAQAPKMAPHIAAMREVIAADLNSEIGRINVKATTTEQLGFTGRKEGIACEAVVLLQKRSS